MPFYEYQCKSCGHELEAMQKVSDAVLKKCPHCGKSQLQRLMSAPVFRLKGGGWYETDFKGDKDNQRNLADKPEADAPKDAKDGDAKGKDGKEEKSKDDKGTEGKSAEPKASEAVTGASKDSAGTAKEKPSEKPAAKQPAEKSTASRRSRKPKKAVNLKRKRR
jgi:putative FmdB family regulatory protein